jgi:hypothetical protein
MFTPRTYAMGDHVKIDSELTNAEGTFAAGHEFEIIGIHFREGEALYDLRDHELHVLLEVPFADISWGSDAP